MSDDHVCADNKTDACPEFYPNDAAAIHRVPAPTATTKPDGWNFANSLNHSLFSGKSSGNFGVAATVVNSLFSGSAGAVVRAAFSCSRARPLRRSSKACTSAIPARNFAYTVYTKFRSHRNAGS